MMAVQLRGPYWLKRGAVHFGINEQSVHTVVCLQIGTNPNLQVVIWWSRIAGSDVVWVLPLLCIARKYVTYGINDMQVQKYVVIFDSMDWSHCSTIKSEPWPTLPYWRNPRKDEKVLTNIFHFLSEPCCALKYYPEIEICVKEQKGEQVSTKQYEMSTNVSYTRIILTKMNEPASYVDEPFSSLWRLESNEENRSFSCS